LVSIRRLIVSDCPLFYYQLKVHGELMGGVEGRGLGLGREIEDEALEHEELVGG
jgi:hypothetical protein